MSDISRRLAVLERLARKQELNSDYMRIYPLAPLEFTILEHQKHKDGKTLRKIWCEVVDEYEGEHQAELKECRTVGVLPPWRYLSLGGFLRKNKPRLKAFSDQAIKNLDRELTNRAMARYRLYESEGRI